MHGRARDCFAVAPRDSSRTPRGVGTHASPRYENLAWVTGSGAGRRPTLTPGENRSISEMNDELNRPVRTIEDKAYHCLPVVCTQSGEFTFYNACTQCNRTIVPARFAAALQKVHAANGST